MPLGGWSVPQPGRRQADRAARIGAERLIAARGDDGGKAAGGLVEGHVALARGTEGCSARIAEVVTPAGELGSTARLWAGFGPCGPLPPLFCASGCPLEP